jgi:Yip1 domain
MTTARDKVLEMVASGKLSSADADQLLSAMQPRGPSPWQWIFHPASVVSTRLALGLGAVSALVALGLARLGVSFDGAFDAHRLMGALDLKTALLQQLIAWPLVAVVLWAAARLAGKSTRVIDMLAAVALGRVPLTLTGVAALLIPAVEGVEALFSPLLWVAAVLILPLVVWGVGLMVTGFRAVSGLRGGRLATSAVAALIVAEVLSHVLLKLVQL